MCVRLRSGESRSAPLAWTLTQTKDVAQSSKLTATIRSLLVTGPILRITSLTKDRAVSWVCCFKKGCGSASCSHCPFIEPGGHVLPQLSDLRRELDLNTLRCYLDISSSTPNCDMRHGGSALYFTANLCQSWISVRCGPCMLPEVEPSDAFTETTWIRMKVAKRSP